MDSHHSTLATTGLEEIAAIEVLRTWIDQVGGNARIPQVLDLLAVDALRSLQTGHPSRALDADTLRQFHVDVHGGRMPDQAASRWLSSTAVETWWDARKASLENACRQAGLSYLPQLTLLRGGGRGNATLYRLDYQPLSTIEDRPKEDGSFIETDLKPVIRYEVEPATAVWWLRPIIGAQPFRMRSMRGYALVGMMLVEALAFLALWLLVLLSLRGPRPIQARDLGLLLVAIALTWTWLHFMQPLIRLPTDRVTVANDFLLGWSQMHGQFRLTRDTKSKVAGGWFQLVRHWSTCPLCAGEIEIASGEPALPGRLVGRCGDSPLEHVFSFDSVSLSGRSLRESRL